MNSTSLDVYFSRLNLKVQIIWPGKASVPLSINSSTRCFKQVLNGQRQGFHLPFKKYEG